MKIVEFIGQTTVLGPPKNWDQGKCECSVLPVQIVEYDRGVIAFVSCWKPSKEDLEILNSGGVIALSVIGGQPPVNITAEKVEILP